MSAATLRAALCLAALALMTTPLGARGQASDCDSICLFPDAAPPECACEALIFGGGGWGAAPSDPVDPEAAALVDRMMESWEEAVAGVDNYTVVQTSSVTPMPAVIYYEKEMIDGHPMFRMVDPAELANREQVARGDPTSQQIFGALADIVAGRRGGEEEGEADEEESGGYQPSGTERALGQLLGGLARDLEGPLRELSRVEEMQTREDLSEELWGWWAFRNRARTGANWTEVVGDLDGSLSEAPCRWVYAYSDAFEEGEMAVLFGQEYEGYELEYLAQCISDSDEAPVPLVSMSDIRAPSGESARVYKRVSDFEFDGVTFVPRRQTLNMEGLGALVEGAVQSLPEVILEIVRVLVNEGPPSQEQVQRLIDEALRGGVGQES